jgi:phosphoserine phosphatase RsbU/P
MRILIADDDPISRTALNRTLRGWGYDVIPVADGKAAWEILQQENAPHLAIVDWMMPELEGPEVCRLVRGLARAVPTYTILLTSRDATVDVVAGLESGADDYVTKPFDAAELRSRLRVGERVVELQKGLADRVRELEDSIARIRRLQKLLPICAWCKSVRNDGDYWQSVEGYIAELADVRLSHGICPTCLTRETGTLVSM